MTNQSNTVAWIEQDQTQLHPLQHPSRHTNPLVIERAEGIYLYTSDGKKILDGMAGLWNVNIGYGKCQRVTDSCLILKCMT